MSITDCVCGWGWLWLDAACSTSYGFVPYAVAGYTLCFRRFAGQPGGIQRSLVATATLSLVVYTFGIPLAFLVILVRHRDAIKRDQALRVANQGASEASNPYFHIRQRYQELYR